MLWISRILLVSAYFVLVWVIQNYEFHPNDVGLSRLVNLVPYTFLFVISCSSRPSKVQKRFFLLFTILFLIVTFGFVFQEILKLNQTRESTMFFIALPFHQFFYFLGFSALYLWSGLIDWNYEWDSNKPDEEQ